MADTGEIKVLDFGIAKALSLSRKVTRNDFGSMPYLSPGAARLDRGRCAGGSLGARRDSVRAAERRAAVPGRRHAPARAADPRRLSAPAASGDMPDRDSRRSCRGCSRRSLTIATSRAGAVLADLGLFEAGHPPEALTHGFPGTARRGPDPPHPAAGRHRCQRPPAAPMRSVSAARPRTNRACRQRPRRVRTRPARRHRRAAATPATVQRAPVRVKRRGPHPIRTC